MVIQGQVIGCLQNNFWEFWLSVPPLGWAGSILRSETTETFIWCNVEAKLIPQCLITILLCGESTRPCCLVVNKFLFRPLLG